MKVSVYFLGLDIGSSSVKLAVFDGESGGCVARAQQPSTEFTIEAPSTGYAEQSPDIWWAAVKQGVKELVVARPEVGERISAIGIAYQMHGLVAIDRRQQVLHPSIIWCDSRAVSVGEQARDVLGADWCLRHLLNFPGNFTLAKLLWLRENRQDVYAKIDKILLPGDYIAMQLSGEVTSTPSGLSEAIAWNYSRRNAASEALEKLDIDPSVIPALVPNFGEGGVLSKSAADELGLKPGIALTYRAGDQPNNAFSLNVLESGEFATTAGTSGVIYAVTDKLIADPSQKTNSFLHVNHRDEPSVGILACINGAGRMNSWLRQLLSATGTDVSYEQLNKLADEAPAGSLGLNVHPFGNGAERILDNKLVFAQMHGVDFNRHQLSHIARAVQEGVAFAMVAGMELINSLGAKCEVIRAGKANMFLSPVFSKTFVNTTRVPLELYDTDGAEGAARAAAWGSGFYNNRDEAFAGLTQSGVLEPDSVSENVYRDIYNQWREKLSQLS